MLEVVDVHKMKKSGESHKYSVHFRMEKGRTLGLTAEQADWDLQRALQLTISNMEKQLDHKYNTKGSKHKDKTF